MAQGQAARTEPEPDSTPRSSHTAIVVDRDPLEPPEKLAHRVTQVTQVHELSELGQAQA
jgi:hypothetical protein